MESGLVGLRAELQKKRAEANKFGRGQKGICRPDVNRQNKKSFNLANAGVFARDAKDKEQVEEEEVSTERAKSILEKKAAMYERLHSGVEALEDDDINQKFLVNFQKKITGEVMEAKAIREEKRRAEQLENEEKDKTSYKASKKADEWIEYTDVLGRTRTCMRKDLPDMVDKDIQLAKETSREEPEDPQLLSEDMLREIQRQKWEREEEANAFKKDMHYQHVMYDEARTHGAGYMRFSKDDTKRKEQMDLLKEMHEEAKAGERAKKMEASKKAKVLQARLEKVRQKKRLKMGLPVKDMEEKKLKTPPMSDDEGEDEDFIGPPLPLAPPQAQPEEPKAVKKKHVREWDLGKEGVKSTLSQEEWVLQQRQQRDNNFAPPSFYEPTRGSGKRGFGDSNPSKQHSSGVSSSSHSDLDPFTSHQDSFRHEERKNDFAPPATYEYYGPSSSKRGKSYTKPSYNAMEDAINRGISAIRNMSNNC